MSWEWVGRLSRESKRKIVEIDFPRRLAPGHKQVDKQTRRIVERGPRKAVAAKALAPVGKSQTMTLDRSQRSIRMTFMGSLTAALTLTAALAACLLFMSPGIASAALMTLTFDDGGYDPNMPELPGVLHGPYDWIDTNGIRSAGWWATDVGTAAGAFQQGHTHIQPNFSGRPDGRFEYMHAWTDDLQGLNISLESGLTFDLISIDYSIRERESTHPDLQRLPWATAPDAAQLLLSTTLFDPTAADLESQWTAIAIDDFGLPYRPFFTLAISGFNDISSFYISQTIAGLAIDSIVLEVHTVTQTPEPTAALLIGLGLAGLAHRPRRESTRD